MKIPSPPRLLFIFAHFFFSFFKTFFFKHQPISTQGASNWMKSWWFNLHRHHFHLPRMSHFLSVNGRLWYSASTLFSPFYPCFSFWNSIFLLFFHFFILKGHESRVLSSDTPNLVHCFNQVEYLLCSHRSPIIALIFWERQLTSRFPFRMFYIEIC